MPNPPRLVAPHTANWRGYVASWRIEGGWLYLDAITATVADPDGSHSTVTDARPLLGRELPIAADWVTDRMRIGRGAEVQHVHGGFDSRWASERVIEVSAGRVTAMEDLAPVSRWGSAGPYQLGSPLLEDWDLTGGNFGTILEATGLDGVGVVAKLPRQEADEYGGTSIAGAPGLLPIFQPAIPGVRADGVFRPHTLRADQVAAVLLREAEILQRDGGRLLPQLHGVWEHIPKGGPVLVMERLTGRPPTKADEVIAVLAALADAVDRGTFPAHGDLKTEHIFVDGDRVRLCDPAPDFDDPSLRAYTPVYNPHGYEGPAADVAACASILRYLPDPEHPGWQWCDDVLRGPTPPQWARNHRTAITALREALADPSVPPPGWTVPPVPKPYEDSEPYGFPPPTSMPSKDVPHPSLPPMTRTFPAEVAKLPGDDGSGPETAAGLASLPATDHSSTYHRFSALQLAFRTSALSLLEAQGPLVVAQGYRSEESVAALIEALRGTEEHYATLWGVPPASPPVTLITRTGSIGPIRVLSVQMMSMTTWEAAPQPDDQELIRRAWNGLVRLDFEQAMGHLEQAVSSDPHGPSHAAAEAIVDTTRHALSALAAIHTDLERFNAGEI